MRSVARRHPVVARADRTDAPSNPAAAPLDPASARSELSDARSHSLAAPGHPPDARLHPVTAAVLMPVHRLIFSAHTIIFSVHTLFFSSRRAPIPSPGAPLVLHRASPRHSEPSRSRIATFLVSPRVIRSSRGVCYAPRVSLSASPDIRMRRAPHDGEAHALARATRVPPSPQPRGTHRQAARTVIGHGPRVGIAGHGVLSSSRGSARSSRSRHAACTRQRSPATRLHCREPHPRSGSTVHTAEKGRVFTDGEPQDSAVSAYAIDGMWKGVTSGGGRRDLLRRRSTSAQRPCSRALRRSAGS